MGSRALPEKVLIFYRMLGLISLDYEFGQPGKRQALLSSFFVDLLLVTFNLPALAPVKA